MKTKIINRTVDYPASHAILLLQYLGMQSLFVRNFVFLYFMDPILGFLGIENCRIEGFPLEKDGKLEINLEKEKLEVVKNQEVHWHDSGWFSTLEIEFRVKSNHFKLQFEIGGNNEKTVYSVKGEGEGNDSYSSTKKLEESLEELLDNRITVLCKHGVAAL